MTPFLQFRLWARNAPASERTTAALVALVVLGLLVWAAVPTGNRTILGAGSTSGPASPGVAGSVAANGASAGSGGAVPSAAPAISGSATGAAAGSSASSPSGSSGGVTGSGGSVGNTAGSIPASSPGACADRSASDQGVSGTQIHVGVILLNLGGPGLSADSAIGLPTPQQQQAMAAAVMDFINKNGGVACRQLVATYYQANPLDTSNEHAVCLQLAQDRVFAAIDGGGLTTPSSVRDCVPQERIPMFSPTALLASEANQFFPYLFSDFGRDDEIMRDSVFAFRDLGLFSSSKGFKKLGLFRDDCAPEVPAQVQQLLAQVGLTSGQISTYDIGCPSGEATPDQLEQAVLQFKTAGVTHVLPLVGAPILSNFTRVAQQQGFVPRYLDPDYQGQINLLETSSQAPDPTNFDNAVGITPTRIGLFNSGLPVNPGTKQCDQILTSHGMQPIGETSYSEGVFCSEFFMFAAAASRAAALTRTDLVGGLDQAGSLDLAFQAGPATFGTARQVTGGSFFEPVQWHRECTCWKVIGQFKPNYR